MYSRRVPERKNATVDCKRFWTRVFIVCLPSPFKCRRTFSEQSVYATLCVRFVYARIIYRSYFKYVLNGRLRVDIFLSTNIISSIRRVHSIVRRTLSCGVRPLSVVNDGVSQYKIWRRTIRISNNTISSVLCWRPIETISDRLLRREIPYGEERGVLVFRGRRFFAFSFYNRKIAVKSPTFLVSRRRRYFVTVELPSDTFLFVSTTQ